MQNRQCETCDNIITGTKGKRFCMACAKKRKSICDRNSKQKNKEHYNAIKRQHRSNNLEKYQKYHLEYYHNNKYRPEYYATRIYQGIKHRCGNFEPYKDVKLCITSEDFRDWFITATHCEICGCDISKNKEIHRKYDKGNYALDNIQALCKDCHKGTWWLNMAIQRLGINVVYDTIIDLKNRA